MKNGLLDIGILSFVFTPLALTIMLLLFICKRRIKDSRAALPSLDTPGLLLTAAVSHMPEERREWGAAMMTELNRVYGLASRWRFALGCVRVAMFPPDRGGPRALTRRSPFCGMLAVAAPPLGLPLIYFLAVIVDAIGGSPLTQSSNWSNPEAAIQVIKIIMMLMFFCLPAGLPLGLAGLLRRERLRWLSMMGMVLSICVSGYFLTVMHFVAGGPNGD